MSSRLEKRSELNDQLLESVGKGEAKHRGVGGSQGELLRWGLGGYINMYIYIFLYECCYICIYIYKCQYMLIQLI